LVEQAEEETTPLEQRLNQLGHRLIWITLALAVVVAVSGILSGREIRLMIETAIALAVASIPEGLPIVATVALARGMWRMAKRNALINRLSAVETLGSTNVIITDKTGTLTENQMTVTRIILPSGRVDVEGEGLKTEGGFIRDGHSIDPTEKEIVAQALKVGILANNASLTLEEDDTRAVGDPVEVALLVAGAKAGWRHDELVETLPEVREEAFDPQIKMMATFHEQDDGQYYVAVKGGPEAVLDVSTHILTPDGVKDLPQEEHETWLERNRELAHDGLRVLAVARKTVDDAGVEPYENLTFLGLVGFLDPPREDVRKSILACKNAGVKVIMATGDQPETARNVAQAVGLVEGSEIQVIRGSDFKPAEELSEEERQRYLETRIFSRVSPKQKLDLIALYQDSGQIVAMTGDGVNDAPALKKAEIGVAMGQRGTQVAREAADMVLRDDAFSTIVVAVEQGRVIFNNIRRFVLYLLSCNISEVMVVALAAMINAPLPILPLQILFLNLVTDVFPALALGVGEGDPHIMEQPPRDPDEPVMTDRHWLLIGGYGVIMTASVLGALFLALRWLGMEQPRAVTISFLTLALAQLWHVFDMRDRGSHFINNDIVKNPWVWGAVALCILLILAAVYVPFLAQLLSIQDPGLNGWLLVLGMSLVTWVVGQTLKELKII
ncbi:MAG: cation-translocating P-type ATPase, partial [Anaerolineae bacterium]